MDPDQTAPIGAVWSGSTLLAPIGAVWSGFTLLAIEASQTFQQTRKADDFCCDWRIKVLYPLFQNILTEIPLGNTVYTQFGSRSDSGHGLKSHLTDCRGRGLSPIQQTGKAEDVTCDPGYILFVCMGGSRGEGGGCQGVQTPLEKSQKTRVS